jgi:hypothetical protein
MYNNYKILNEMYNKMLCTLPKKKKNGILHNASVNIVCIL